MSSVIHLEQLSKVYQSRQQPVQAVNQLSLDVAEGQIYGFLGPNGAGKTTTIRMMLNLIHPSSGEVHLFGKSLRKHPQAIYDRVGALVEEASFYPFMTGYDNLKTLAVLSSNGQSKRIEEVLEVVGMTPFAHRKAKTYSTGMKQRLGVAAALLSDPDLLILDEPINGLDPKGIQDMRTLLQHLAQNDGKTIFLSSHLLHEIEQTCDRVAIIKDGSLIQEGHVTDLLASKTVVQITAIPLKATKEILLDYGEPRIVGELIELSINYDKIPDLIAHLTMQNIQIYEVTRKRRTLEDLFLEVTHA